MGIKNLFSSKKVLYYPGCLTKAALKQEFENYREIFRKIGIDYILLPEDEVCCGLPVLNAGYKKETKKLAQKNLELFKKHNIKKIVTNCPACYRAFKEIYPVLLREWDIEVEHATITILNALKRKNIKFKGDNGEREIVAYHDPCHLARHGKDSNDEICNQPREVIELLGGKIAELKYNRENAFCCGGGGGLRANFPQISKDIAKKKIQYTPQQAEKIISPCGLCYLNLKDATEKSEEFSSFVLRKMKARN